MVNYDSIFKQQKDIILPFFHEPKFITDFKEIAEIFNSQNTKECALLNNSSKLPSECQRKSNKHSSSFTFEVNNIEKIIKNLDPFLILTQARPFQSYFP